MAEGSENHQKKRERGGYRRLLSQQFSFKRSEEKEAKAALESPKRSSSVHQRLEMSGAHPVINVLEAAPSKKAASRPEFLRYLEYMKEAGTWEPNSDGPVIYFK